jgi:hypothetical protein
MNSKLRYYLRGLGIGMAVTALILTLVNLKNNRGEMTDAQIRERAAQLGMVDANSYSLTDAVEDSQAKTEEKPEDKKEEVKPEEKSEPAEETKSEETVTEETKPEEAEEVKPEETEEVKPEETEEVKSEEPGETKPEETEEAKPAETEEVKPEEPQEKEPEETKPQQPKEGEATITIQNGSSSETACMLLKNAGLIDNAEDLNRYMIQHGYDRTIHPGTFTLPYGLSFEEICKRIAG